MKLIVAGGRDFTNQEYMAQSLIELNRKGLIPDNPILVCGMARGADRLAYDMWVSHGMEFIEMPAEWDKYGKSAGHRRNADMGNIADACVAFWDGKSVGTKGMIAYMAKLHKPCYVFHY